MTDRIFSDRSALGSDGSVRKSHYGDGEQPWDVMVRMGIAPAFAAGSILKYLRRTKDPEHSLESARWYWARLGEMEGAHEHELRMGLVRELTDEELLRLEC